ncbi:MAG: aldehyde ferredoxin oxidoreductase family protein, partial [Bacillota bacterium]
ELPPHIDPLGEENKLIFATGILTGAPVAAMPRFSVGAKSPLTGAFGESEAGGFWGPELKKAGYDALIIEGKAPAPVYIYIHDDKIEIKDARHLWGKETGDTQNLIRDQLKDQNVRIAQIGPGGENLVRFACITNELKHFNGRNGLGAVMGSKNLKAVAVRGTKRIPFADEEKIKEIGKRYLAKYMNHPMSRTLYEFGTSAGVTSLNAGGNLPTKNFIKGEFAGADKISGQTMADTILQKREGCYACAVRCKRAVKVDKEQMQVDPKFGGPEYETIGSFGSLCEIDDLELIAKANELCNRYTIDTISTGASIAFAMECFEKGILSKDDLDGMELTFGNGEAVLQLIEKIAKREGIGDLLAEGSASAARKIGKGSEKFTLCVKGQELPMHDPRAKYGLGLGYAVSEIGADHMVAAHDPLLEQKGIILDSVAPLGILEPVSPRELTPRKVRNFSYLQQWWCFHNMAGICHFGPVPRGSLPMDDVVDLVKAAAGWDTSLWEIMKSAERVINMARMFNIREGFTREDDTIPERLFEPLENGKLQGHAIPREEFQQTVEMYYAFVGWNEEGVPSKTKLAELELDWIAEKM